MGLADRDYMREGRRREARFGTSSTAWSRPSSRSRRGWGFALGLPLIAVPIYSTVSRGGWMPDLARGQPFPESGSVTVARSVRVESLTSWLEVQTGAANAVVQLFQPQSGKHVLSIYVAGDDRVRVPVPHGSFQVRLIEGRKWHGRSRYFGPNTSYETVMAPLDFNTGGVQTIDLRRRVDDNLPTRTMLSRPPGV